MGSSADVRRVESPHPPGGTVGRPALGDDTGEQGSTVGVGHRDGGDEGNRTGEHVEPFGRLGATWGATLGGACRKFNGGST